MKRQKRDQSDRVFSRGYIAATRGISRSQCPYENGPKHQQWMNGWREGREDYWNGLGSSAKAQKLENYQTISTDIHFPDGWRTV